MKYFIYARKSTEDEDRQILSIEAQLVELKEFAAKEKLEIVKERGESGGWRTSRLIRRVCLRRLRPLKNVRTIFNIGHQYSQTRTLFVEEGVNLIFLLRKILPCLALARQGFFIIRSLKIFQIF